VRGDDVESPIERRMGEAMAQRDQSGMGGQILKRDGVEEPEGQGTRRDRKGEGYPGPNEGRRKLARKARPGFH
jgi:hypothetical protein